MTCKLIKLNFSYTFSFLLSTQTLNKKNIVLFLQKQVGTLLYDKDVELIGEFGDDFHEEKKYLTEDLCQEQEVSILISNGLFFKYFNSN